MKLESLKSSKFDTIEKKQLKTLSGGGQGTVTHSGGWVRCTSNGKSYGAGPGAIPMEQDYVCQNQDGSLTVEVLVDGRWI